MPLSPQQLLAEIHIFVVTLGDWQMFQQQIHRVSWTGGRELEVNASSRVRNLIMIVVPRPQYVKPARKTCTQCCLLFAPVCKQFSIFFAGCAGFQKVLPNRNTWTSDSISDRLFRFCLKSLVCRSYVRRTGASLLQARFQSTAYIKALREDALLLQNESTRPTGGDRSRRTCRRRPWERV